jgi:hypothetical protein
MKRIGWAVVTAVVQLFMILELPAQLPGGGQPGVNGAMLKLFSDISAFSSKAEVRFTDKSTKEVTTMTMGFMMQDRKVRLELDMSQIKSKQLTKESLTAMKAAGLDKLVTVVRPDRKVAMLIYPAVAGYVEMPMTRDEAQDMDRNFTVSKTKIGKESIDGHPCEKYKVVLTSSNGASQEAIVSYATDLREFPLRIEMNQPGTQLVMVYKAVNLARPEVKLFEAPLGFTRHTNVELLMQSAAFKSLSQPGR